MLPNSQSHSKLVTRRVLARDQLVEVLTLATKDKMARKGLDGFNAWDCLSICNLVHSKQNMSTTVAHLADNPATIETAPYPSASAQLQSATPVVTWTSQKNQEGTAAEGFMFCNVLLLFLATHAKSSGFWSASGIIFTECPHLANRHRSVLHVKRDLPHVLSLPSTDLSLWDFWLHGLKPHLKNNSNIV